MSIGAMLSDIVSSLFKHPATELYPFERNPAPVNLRGKLYFDPEKCSGCQLCIKDCPSDAIELITVDKVNKRFVMRYNIDRCIDCAQCVVNCRFKCLSMSSTDWELASTNKEAFEVYYGREEDIAALLARSTEECAEVAGEG